MGSETGAGEAGRCISTPPSEVQCVGGLGRLEGVGGW